MAAAIVDDISSERIQLIRGCHALGVCVIQTWDALRVGCTAQWSRCRCPVWNLMGSRCCATRWS
eukprot:1644616-Amphidinium_carterae.4